MEHTVHAGTAGTVTEVDVAEGDQVETGRILVVVEPVGGGGDRGRGRAGERGRAGRRLDAVSEPLRIANCSGFYGDRLSAAKEMVEGGPIDVLTGDWLAELTMLILWKGYQRDHSKGWAHTFLTQMEEVLGTCIDRGIKVVTNAGGLNPAGLADQIRALADRLGLDVAVAHVEGDDLLPRIGELNKAGHPLAHLDTGQPLADATGEVISANAYLGGWPIVEALSGGARRGDLPPDHRRLPGGGAGSLAPRMVADRLGPVGRGGGGRPRHRVRAPGHRRQLRLLHRGGRPRAPGVPDRRGGGRRLVGDHQAPRHRGRGVGGDGHGPAALRDRRAPLPQHRCRGPLRHGQRRPGGARPGAGQRYPWAAGTGRCEGVPQPAGRLAQLDDLRPHRARHRGEGGPHPAVAGRAPWGAPGGSPSSTPASSARTSPTRRSTSRPPPSCGSRSRTPIPSGWAGSFSSAATELALAGYPGPPPHRAALSRNRLRRLLAGTGARRSGGPRSGPRRRPQGDGPPHRASGRP